MMGAAALLCLASLLPAVDGIALDDSTIRTAFAAWLSDSAAAEATYGHISDWDTSGVTDMSYLFCAYSRGGYSYYGCNAAAASFNEDIGAWDTSGVTTMHGMFYEAAAFNHDIGGWAVHSVTDMWRMFYGASAFDQDLGWCVGNGVDLDDTFSNTPCASTSCGVNWATAVRCGGSGRATIDDGTIKTAVGRWLSNPTAAEAVYGHISTWETGGVTDMAELFCAWDCGANTNPDAESFDEDIDARVYQSLRKVPTPEQCRVGWGAEEGNYFARTRTSKTQTSSYRLAPSPRL